MGHFGRRFRILERAVQNSDAIRWVPSLPNPLFLTLIFKGGHSFGPPPRLLRSGAARAVLALGAGFDLESPGVPLHSPVQGRATSSPAELLEHTGSVLLQWCGPPQRCWGLEPTSTLGVPSLNGPHPCLQIPGGGEAACSHSRHQASCACSGTLLSCRLFCSSQALPVSQWWWAGSHSSPRPLLRGVCGGHLFSLGTKSFSAWPGAHLIRVKRIKRVLQERA